MMGLDANTAREHMTLASQLLEADPPDVKRAGLRIRMAHECLERVKQETKQLNAEFNSVAAEMLSHSDSPLPVGMDHEIALVSERRMKCRDQKAFARDVFRECGPETLIDLLASNAIKPSSASRGCPELYGQYFENMGTGELQVKKRKRKPVGVTP